MANVFLAPVIVSDDNQHWNDEQFIHSHVLSLFHFTMLGKKGERERERELRFFDDIVLIFFRLFHCFPMGYAVIAHHINRERKRMAQIQSIEIVTLNEMIFFRRRNFKPHTYAHTYTCKQPVNNLSTEPFAVHARVLFIAIRYRLPIINLIQSQNFQMKNVRKWIEFLRDWFIKSSTFHWFMNRNERNFLLFSVTLIYDSKITHERTKNNNNNNKSSRMNEVKP